MSRRKRDSYGWNGITSEHNHPLSERLKRALAAVRRRFLPRGPEDTSDAEKRQEFARYMAKRYQQEEMSSGRAIEH